MKKYLRIFQYIKPYKLHLFASFILALIFSVANVFMVPWLRDMTTELSNKNGTFFVMQMINGLVLWSIRVLSRFGQFYLTAWIGGKVIWDIQTKIYHKLLGMSQHFYSRWKLGDLLTRLFSDSSQVKELILITFRDAIPQLVTFVGVLAYLFHMSWKLSLFSFVAIPLFIILLSKFATKIKSITFKVQKKTADITHISQEVISNIKLVQTYTMEDKEKEKFAKEMKRNFSFNMIIARLRGTMAAILEQAQGIIVLALMFVGGSMIINTTLTGPELLAYFTGVMLLIDPIQALSNVYVSTQEAMASTERMFEILDEKVHISNSPQAITHSIKGKITFDSVGFTYDSRSKNVLNTINLTANEGEIVALVGLSGAGKSTLINLISRLYDPSQGCVRIDDIDIKTMDLGSLRSQIAMVLQEDMMFRGTIGENIRYGSPNAKEKDIIDAAEKANAMEFISTFPKGLHTKVGDKARRLSGGQKQRISIARAILKNPRILILDEATSSLDSHSESLVQEALNRLMKGRTTIVIAHRLSTIEHANTILVLDKGTIIESGSHHELLKRSGHYKHLYELQFAKKSEKHPIKASSDA